MRMIACTIKCGELKFKRTNYILHIKIDIVQKYYFLDLKHIKKIFDRTQYFPLTLWAFDNVKIEQCKLLCIQKTIG